MDNSTMDNRKFEKLCKSKFEEVYNTKFKKGKVSEKINKNFDFISMDGKIVGDAKFYKDIPHPSGKLATISEYIYLLEKCNADLRFLVFGNDIEIPERWLKKYGNLLKDKKGNTTIKFYFLDHKTNELKELN